MDPECHARCARAMALLHLQLLLYFDLDRTGIRATHIHAYSRVGAVAAPAPAGVAGLGAGATAPTGEDG